MKFQRFRFQQGRETTSMTFLLVFGNFHSRSKPEAGSSVLAKQEKGIDLKALQLEAGAGTVLPLSRALLLLLLLVPTCQKKTLSSMACGKNVSNICCGGIQPRYACQIVALFLFFISMVLGWELGREIHETLKIDKYKLIQFEVKGI